jgi:tRNA-guanine family transglycosylase
MAKVTMTDFGFTLHKTDGEARLGAVHTGRGDIRTPAFMPVGTVGTVKGLYLDQVKDAGSDIILGNTYHLMLRPGPEEVAALGGLHKFISWNGPILTDSGGFQIMSLSKIRKITEQGAVFQSHIDGRRHELTPERAMEIQRLLGSDIRTRMPRRRCNCHCAGRHVRAAPSARSRGGAISASCRAASMKRCGAQVLLASKTSTSKAMRSAGSLSVRARS